MSIRDVLTRKGERIETVGPSRKPIDIVESLVAKRISSVAVIDGVGESVGSVTGQLIIRALANHGGDVKRSAAIDVMRSPVPFLFARPQFGHGHAKDDEWAPASRVGKRKGTDAAYRQHRRSCQDADSRPRIGKFGFAAYGHCGIDFGVELAAERGFLSIDQATVHHRSPGILRGNI